MGLGGRDWAQPKEVCTATMAFDEAPKMHPLFIYLDPPRVLLLCQILMSNPLFVFGNLLK